MNINRKKKNCNGCKAGRHAKCDLGYERENFSYEDHGYFITLFGVPQEPCPKPLTFSDFLFACEWYKKKDYK